MYEKILAFKELLFSKTRLEFRLIWRRIFQTDDQEVEWLLDPRRSEHEANLLASFNRNYEDGYQYNYDTVSSHLGRERVTIYNRGVAKKADLKKQKSTKSTFKESVIRTARDMGMGVQMCSSMTNHLAFPAPYLYAPFASNQQIFDATLEGRNMYDSSALSLKVW